MKKALLVLIAIICRSPLGAVTEYSVGDGRRVILNDDGTYEIVTDTIDT